MDKQKVIVIWAWFGGLGSAILLARAWYDVTVLEKNDKVWGRANLLEINGYKRDMWPSWYLMPDAFDRFFTAIGRKVEDYLDLQKLEPSYRVFFKESQDWAKANLWSWYSLRVEGGKSSTKGYETMNNGANYLDLYADVDQTAQTFEQIEPRSGDKLRAYLKSAAYQYGIAMEKFVFKNFDSIWDFMTPQLAIEGMQLNVFTKLYNYVSRFVKNENLKKLLMYPSVFLGTSPYETPALFNIMSHVDFNQWVFYPQWWIHEIPKALYQIALEEWVKFEFDAEVEKIIVENKKVIWAQLKSNESNWWYVLPQNHQMALKKVIDMFVQHEINYQITWWAAASIYWSNRKINDIDIDVESLDDIAVIRSYFRDNVLTYEISPNYEKFVIDWLLLLEIDWIQIEICDLDRNSARQYCPNGLDYIVCDLGDMKINVVKESILIDNKKYLSREQDIIDVQNLSNTFIKKADIIISNADMRHTETQLLELSQQTYPQSYWAKQVISPSWFILYLWVDGELPQLKHHTLVFSDDWKGWFDQIFKDPQRPQDPNYYICNPSKTDPTVAPAGKENLFVLVPIAPWLDSTTESLEAYRDHIIADIAHNCGIPDLQDRIEVSQIFSIPQFEQYYNAYKGTALGLAHTFFQSAVRRPQNYSKKVKWLYYAGGYTTPGIGMPMCLISAMMVADRVEKNK